MMENEEQEENKNMPVHPGRILHDEYLNPELISPKQFAEKTGIPSRNIYEIIKGSRAVTMDTAVRFAKYLNPPAEYWMDLQALYDLHLAMQKLGHIIPFAQVEDAIIHQPHDKIFKIVFSCRTEAESFFRAYLPAELISMFDWETLVLESSGFIDDELKDSESDLLFRVNYRNSEKTGYLHILFEHQSTPEKWIRLRIYKYKGRIWDESFKKYPEQEKLIPILPVVFYQGKHPWSYSTKFSELIEETELDRKYVPKFEHVLLDHSGIGNEKIKGTIKARIAQLLIKAHYHGKFQEIMGTIVDLLDRMPETPGLNYAKIFIVYIGTTQGYETVSGFVEMMNKKSKETGGSMLSAIDHWKKEGELEGKLEGKKEGKLEGKMEEKIATIEKLLQSGMNWDFIKGIFGFDETGFDVLKKEYQEFVSKASV